MIILKDVSKVYGDREYAVNALNNCNLEIKDGEFVAVIGASGSGKSTLLKIIGALLAPSSGKIVIDNEIIDYNNDCQLSRLHRRKFGFVFQSYNLIPELTAYENIILPLIIDKHKPNTNLDGIINQLGINDILDRIPYQMSGGQQQRVAIARALSTDANIILCDEPTGNLDEENRYQVLSLLKRINKLYNKTVVIVTHDNSITNYSDRLILIRDGNVVE